MRPWKPGRGIALLRALCAALMLVPLAAAAATTPRERLHATMAEALQAQQLQGAVWSTLAPDGTIAADAAGVRDSRDGAPLAVDARVHVGSVAKTLLATGVLRLVSEGRLALDTPLSELLPAMSFDNPWAAEEPLRLRHLLDHTAGLDDARFAQVFSLQARADAPLAQAFAGQGPLRVRSRPGSRHSYSNTGYTLLGMIVEAATGERYEAWLDANLLQPLGMHDSSFGYTTQAGPQADPRLAMGHFEHGVRQAAVPTLLRPATQFTTTATDMGRLARFLLGDGRIDGRRLIDPALLRRMGEPVATEAAEAGLQVGYGLGLATRDRHGAVGRCHGGSTVGYRAMFCLFPGSDRAFFVAINADQEDADYGVFDRALVDALQLPPVPPPGPPDTRVDAAAWAGWYVPAPNRFASFAGLDATLGFVRVEADAGGLHFAPFQAAAQRLLPAGGALLRADDRTIPSHALIVAADGTRVISTGLQSYEQVALPVLAARWLSLAGGLLGLAWLLLAGLARAAFRREGWWRHPATPPFLAGVALLLPLPFFLRQSFLQLGDLTLASGLLAAVTLALPLAMVAGLGLAWRRRPLSPLAIVDAASMLAVLQWCGVLAYWGLLPTRLWS